jgi:hypothetical protein
MRDECFSHGEFEKILVQFLHSLLSVVYLKILSVTQVE